MELYFVKATYTNNVYQLSDFYTGTNYVQNANKKVDALFKPDDGITSIIVKNILPDNTNVRDYTHVICPSLNKIYRIVSNDYQDNAQTLLTLDDDPFIANYQELKTKNIILKRTNDYNAAYFRGINDTAKIGYHYTLSTNVIASSANTGKWALLFFQFDKTKTRLGLTYDAKNTFQFETFTTYAAMVSAYPQEHDTKPTLYYDKYQKICYVSSEVQLYQMQYYWDGTDGYLKWVKITLNSADKYFSSMAAVTQKNNSADSNVAVVALPFDSNIYYSGKKLISYEQFVGTSDPDFLIDVKIVDDILLPINSISYTYDSVNRTMIKNITATKGNFLNLFADASTSTIDSNYTILSFVQFQKYMNISHSDTLSTPLDYEPFNEYELYVFGKKYNIPGRYISNTRMMIGLNSGVINYSIYYGSFPGYAVASGSFTHSAKWKADKLDAFYNQNPTYKDQFFLKMATDASKTIIGGAVGGSVVPGIGTLVGAAGGVGAAALDAGLSLVNLGLQEKSLRLQPDQMHGEISELSLQLLFIFGIYWLKKSWGASDLMETEYFIKGFPTSYVTTIDTLTARSNDIFGTCKIVYGEIKSVVKNEYVTGYINNKLSNGVILI